VANENRGGRCRTFEGRAYGSSFADCNDNSGKSGRGASAWNFINSTQLSLRNLLCEGGGSTSFRFDGCRMIEAENLSASPGYPTDPAWQPSHQYARGDMVVAQSMANPANGVAKSKKVFESTGRGVSGAAEPAWQDKITEDGGVQWRTAGDAVQDSLVISNSRSVHIRGRIGVEGSAPCSARRVYALVIDGNCRDCTAEEFEVSGVIGGSPDVGAAREISIDPRAVRCWATGVICQAWEDRSEPYRVGAR
jgi:hypothetical protein